MPSWKLAVLAPALFAFAATARAQSQPPVVEDEPIGPPTIVREGTPDIEREVVTGNRAVVVETPGVRPGRARREYRREVRRAARDARRFGTTTVLPTTTIGPARSTAVIPSTTTITETIVEPVPTTTVITTPRSAVIAPIDPLVPASYYYPVQPRGFRLRGPFGGGMSLTY